MNALNFGIKRLQFKVTVE